MSDKQRLEQLLYWLADDIADEMGDDAVGLRWSRRVRGCADWVRAGSAEGLRNFFIVFKPDPRNHINEHSFAQSRTASEAARLASELPYEHDREEDRLRAAERGARSSPA